MNTDKSLSLAPLFLAALLACGASATRADVITDWNQKCAELVTEAKLGTPPAVRLMAMVQTAAHDAVEATTAREPAAGAVSVDAAVAAAHRVTLTRLLPAQQASIDAAYRAALAPLADGPARAAGLALGEKAAADVLARRLDDGAATPEAYRPHASAGVYVPTAPAAIPQWSQRKPWLLASASQVRPAAPPALSSAEWVADFDEVRTLGARQSTRRSAEQTEAARFWDYSLPAIYHGVLQSVALQPGRDVRRNARLYALTAQAMDDALIAVFDAKYHYHFWRPVTAIRNGDGDGNDATQREASWQSLIDAPMHPEYPSGHSILAATLGTIVKADLGTGATPVLSTSSPTAKGATRRWTRIDDFVREVSDARVWGGIHFRSATRAGEAMGRRIGELAAERLDAAQ
jgi:PAP2 superfamily